MKIRERLVPSHAVVEACFVRVYPGGVRFVVTAWDVVGLADCELARGFLAEATPETGPSLIQIGFLYRVAYCRPSDRLRIVSLSAARTVELPQENPKSVTSVEQRVASYLKLAISVPFVTFVEV